MLEAHCGLRNRRSGGNNSVQCVPLTLARKWLGLVPSMFSICSLQTQGVLSDTGLLPVGTHLLALTRHGCPIGTAPRVKISLTLEPPYLVHSPSYYNFINSSVYKRDNMGHTSMARLSDSRSPGISSFAFTNVGSPDATLL